ncbi:MAG: MgtC/SapB family protein, partial [Pseudomonadales bacterium]|nr:MgtC/SapB family protein [Pseudomonadales bacterium]
MNEELQSFYFLGVALVIGLLIGVERGWKEREAKDGERIAGIRTYALIGLLGGGTALLTQSAGGLVIGLAYVAIAGALTTVYVVNLRRGDEDVGITSLITGLVTFMLGALAGLGEVVVAAAFGVVTTLLLSHKPTLHRWVGTLKGKELRAGIKLLLITVALLPILPDK